MNRKYKHSSIKLESLRELRRMVEAMELAMAAAMAYGITKSAAMVETQTKLYRDHMKRCRATTARTIRLTRWATSR